MDVNNPMALLSAMAPVDWAFVGLASLIILGILGPRMLRDIRGWLA